MPNLLAPTRRTLLAGGVASLAATGAIGAYASTVDLPPDLAAPGQDPRTGRQVPLPPPAAPMPPPLPRAALGEEDRAEWAAFRTRFITPEGRVVDTANGHASHSEGQGWGLLFAAAFDDRATFDRLHAWTRRWLRRPSDSLHAWRYKPMDPNPVSDTNNATDGDLFIAGALARAARQWDRPDLAAQAAAIGRDVLRSLVRQAGHRTVLLPGAHGFEKDGGVIVNPSYYAFSVLPDVAAVAPSPTWARLQADGLALLAEGRFGPWGLPPDWLRVDRRSGELSVAQGWPARFSYDAIRIPLHLAWARLEVPGFQDAFARYWRAPRSFPPAWADLRTGQVAEYPAEAGTRAVAQLALGGARAAHGKLPPVRAATDYYSAALVVLSRLAVGESKLLA